MRQVFGARAADLTVKAKKTRLYVCRVNDPFGNVVFSDWVKLKVLDIDKTGTPLDSRRLAPPPRCRDVISVSFSFSVASSNLLAPPGLPAGWQGEPHIAVNPEAQTVRPGAEITLRCAAFGIPTPHYQWYRNGQELADGTGDTLQVNTGCLLASLLIARACTVADGCV